MISPYLDAIPHDPSMEEEMHFIDYEETLLTRKAFTLKEKASFKFMAEPLRVKTAAKPIHFETQDGLAFDLQSLAVSTTEISMSFRISRLDGKPVTLNDYWGKYNIAVLADHARTIDEGGFSREQDDGSQLYTLDFTITGETDQLILIPAGKELFTEIMEQQTIPDQVNQVIYVELE